MSWLNRFRQAVAGEAQQQEKEYQDTSLFNSGVGMPGPVDGEFYDIGDENPLQKEGIGMGLIDSPILTDQYPGRPFDDNQGFDAMAGIPRLVFSEGQWNEQQTANSGPLEHDWLFLPEGLDGSETDE